jgi:hypothetical protein
MNFVLIILSINSVIIPIFHMIFHFFFHYFHVFKLTNNYVAVIIITHFNFIMIYFISISIKVTIGNLLIFNYNFIIIDYCLFINININYI